MQSSDPREKILNDLITSSKRNVAVGAWKNMIETDPNLKTKFMNALTSGGERTVSVNRRQRSLIRKLLWVTGLWKLNLPETEETLQFAYFFKNIEVQEYIKSISRPFEIQPPKTNQEGSEVFNEIVSEVTELKKAAAKKGNKFVTL